MNRLQRTKRIDKLRSRISSFLAIVIGTFIFWLVGFAFYNMVNSIVIDLCKYVSNFK